MSKLSDLSGLACTTSGGVPGQTTPTVHADNSVTFTCDGLSTNSNCTHSTGFHTGSPSLTPLLNYTDCNDPLGTPGDATTYTRAMAQAAADAYSSFKRANPPPNTMLTRVSPFATSGDLVNCNIRGGITAVPGVELALQFVPGHWLITVWAYGNLGAAPVGDSTLVAGYVSQAEVSGLAPGSVPTSADIPCPVTANPSWT